MYFCPVSELIDDNARKLIGLHAFLAFMHMISVPDCTLCFGTTEATVVTRLQNIQSGTCVGSTFRCCAYSKRVFSIQLLVL